MISPVYLPTPRVLLTLRLSVFSLSLSLADPSSNYDETTSFGEEPSVNIDDSHVAAISCLECVIWMNHEYQTSNGLQSRVEWTLIVGDTTGHICLQDITNVNPILHPILCVIAISSSFPFIRVFSC
jgi:hypothetical protein